MSEQPNQTKAADGQSLLTDGLCMDIPPGWKFEPLYRRCPNCGFNLSKEFIHTKNNKSETKKIENDAERPRVAWVASEHATGTNHTDTNQNGFQRMIDPLAETNPEKPKRNKRGWSYWKSLEKPGTRKKEDKDTRDHYYLVPVIKRDFGKRIIQWLLRAVA